MKKILFLLSAVVALTFNIPGASAQNTADGNVMYGYMLASSNNNLDAGLYQFTNPGYKLKWRDNDYDELGDKINTCWYADGKVKGYKLIVVNGSPMIYSYVEFDLQTGATVVKDLHVNEGAQSFIQYNASYDAENDIIYAFGYVRRAEKEYDYGLVKINGSDPLTATMLHPIDDTLPEQPRSMCFNSDDKMLYAINRDCELLRIDPSDGSVTADMRLIYNSDARYISAMVYNADEKKYYWNPNPSDGSSAMATIDPATGKVNVYDKLKYGEEFISLFFAPASAGVDNPAAADTVSITAASGCVTISGYTGTVTVTGIDGRTAAVREVSGTATIDLPSGVYIVQAGTKVAKTFIK